MKTLFVAPQAPWPLDVGSKIRIHHLVKSYTELGSVTLVCFAQSHEEAQYVAEVERHGGRAYGFPLPAADSRGASRAGRLGAVKNALHPRPRVLRYFESEALAGRIESLLAGEPFDVLHLERLGMVENVKRVFRSRNGAPRPFRVLDLDDVESSKMKRMAAMEPWSSSRKYVRGLEWLKLSASEQRHLPEFDCLLVCSEKDRRVVQAKWRRSRVEVFANGADVNTVCSEPRDDGRTVVFLGAMNYQPNEDAVLFFVELVLPILRQRIPDARFVIAGKSPSAKVRALNNGKDVLVIGYAQDKAAVLSSCTVFVVPIRMGGGTRIKILEAMAAGVPVVSTTVGCEGIDAIPGEAVVIADSPEDFAAACATLLLDPARRHSLARAGRLLVQRQYQWEDIRTGYLQTLRHCLQGHGSPGGWPPPSP